MKMGINRIVEGVVNRFLLNEAMTDIVYHFTSPHAALNICRTNTLNMSECMTRVADTMHNKKLFYLSTTRQFNGTQGYSRGYNARIELDGQKLNERFEAKPVNYWGSRMASEYEDRLFSDEPYITDANKYIRKISLLVEGTYENEYAVAYHCLLFALQNGINVEVYGNIKDFNNPRSTNIINDKILSMTSLNGVNPLRLEGKNNLIYALNRVIDFCVAFERVEHDKIEHYVSDLLRKYGLVKYISQAITYTKEKSRYFRHYLPDVNLSLIRSEDEYNTICNLFRDVLKRNGVRNVREAEIKWKNPDKVEKKNYDLEGSIKLLVFKRGFSKIGIINPDKTPFWSIFREEDVKNYKRNFYDTLTFHDSEYGLRSHNSRNDEYFDKYVMHLIKSNKISVTEMLDILSKFDYNTDDLVDTIFYGKFVEEDISYWDCWKYAKNPEEEKKLQELFRKK